MDLSPRHGRFVFPALRNSVFVPFPDELPFTPSYVEVKSPVDGVMAFNLTRIGFVCGLQPEVIIEKAFPVDWVAVI